MKDDPKIPPSDSSDLAALRALPPHDVDAAHAAANDKERSTNSCRICIIVVSEPEE